MCSICGFSQCPPRCPNAPEPKVRGYCERCGDELREGYEYYTDVGDNKYCSIECAIEHYEIKSKEWEEEEW